MADVKSTVESVLAAEREVYGPISEAQSLMEIYRNVQDMDAFACLARGTLERFVDAFEAYHSELVKHGRAPNPSHDELLASVQLAPVAQGEADA